MNDKCRKRKAHNENVEHYQVIFMSVSIIYSAANTAYGAILCLYGNRRLSEK